VSTVVTDQLLIVILALCDKFCKCRVYLSLQCFKIYEKKKKNYDLKKVSYHIQRIEAKVDMTERYSLSN
jgi:hypothetical protein